MKLFVVLALTLASVAAFDLRGNYIKPRNVFMPVIDQPEGRIINGAEASINTFPYQVGLSLSSSIMSTWCGGSLLNREWVMTAAHCTDGISTVRVHLGSSVVSSPLVMFTVNKENIIIHPQWNSQNFKNDISLIRIPTVEYSATIQPVKLPQRQHSYSNYENEKVIASGWGLTYDGSTSVSSVLQYVDLNTITNTQCRGTFDDFVSASNICVATTDGKSTCQGDSGGPLVRAADKVQIGLTSYGAAVGCEKGFPVVFTRVTSFLDWIADITGIEASNDKNYITM